jgi:hypothetical protein
MYGVKEINPLNTNGQDYHSIDRETVDWDDKTLFKITRLRLLSDPGFPYWDVSYCDGVLKDFTPVTVRLPFNQLPKKNMFGEIIKYARQDKVYAKGLGVFEALSTLN